MEHESDNDSVETTLSRSSPLSPCLLNPSPEYRPKQKNKSKSDGSSTVPTAASKQSIARSILSPASQLELLSQVSALAEERRGSLNQEPSRATVARRKGQQQAWKSLASPVKRTKRRKRSVQKRLKPSKQAEKSQNVQPRSNHTDTTVTWEACSDEDFDEIEDELWTFEEISNSDLSDGV